MPSLAPGEAFALLGRQQPDALGIPMLAPATEEQLLDAFMPAMAIRHTSNGLAANDRPLRLIADASGAIIRDISQPTIYTHISFGRYQEQVTIQLNYSVWFKERRAGQPLDLLAGQFDGLTWRVHGTHAIAFIGQRHFDAPRILDELGLVSESPQSAQLP